MIPIILAAASYAFGAFAFFVLFREPGHVMRDLGLALIWPLVVAALIVGEP